MWNIYKGLYKSGLGLTAGLAAFLLAQGCANFPNVESELQHVENILGLRRISPSQESRAAVSSISE